MKTRKPTRIELEDSHSDLEKRIKETSTVLEQKEIALRYAQEDLEEHQQRVAHHETNMNYMLTKADVVDIKEFSGVLKLLDRSREEAEDATKKVNDLHGWVAKFRKAIDRSKAELARVRAVLDECGQVIPGPWRVR